jgi:hypothetical protein
MSFDTEFGKLFCVRGGSIDEIRSYERTGASTINTVEFSVGQDADRKLMNFAPFKVASSSAFFGATI